MTVLNLQNLSVRRGKDEVLHDVSFTISEREIVTIVGPNGSGKSTLLKAVVGALSPSKGKITRKKGLRIGYVPQKLHVDPTLPISVRRFLDLPRKAPKNRIAQVIDETGIEALLPRQMADLSGGQFQRVLLARALLREPHLLILDEATQGLDQPGSAQFYRLIEEVRAEHGCAILMVSHELHVVMAASDKVICLNGHVCCAGKPEAVASAPEYRALFGSGSQGALALYRHEHNHSHEHVHDHNGDCDHAG